MPARIDQIGVISVNPATPISDSTNGGPSLVKTLNLGTGQVVDEHMDGYLSLVSAINTVLPFGTITTASYLALRVLSGALIVELTTPAGSAQLVTVARWLILDGAAITLIRLSGTATLEFILGGS
jgi:hypothetical protein